MNNREIKFRAWDGHSIIRSDEWPNLSGFFGTRGKQEVLMQFTGLCDVKGVEIYEGDVVKTGEEFGEVQYDPEQASFIILFQPHNKKQKSGCSNLASTWPTPQKEIIGNIYESPELLEV